MGNVLEKMLDALTGAYCREDIKREKKGLPPETNIGKLYSLFAGGLEKAEQGIETLQVWDSVENAEGTVLDRWGNNFGVKREGADDEFYRLLILVKMIAQLSGGDVDTVIEAAAALFQVATEQIDLEEVFPAKVRIYIQEDNISEKQWAVLELISKMLKRVVAAGVGFKLFTKENREIHSRLLLKTGLIESEQVVILPAQREDTFHKKYYIGSGCIETEHVKLQPRNMDQKGRSKIYYRAGMWEETRMKVGQMREN